ncbi:sulfite exporter TauE/SafE family protein [Gulosibacter macacae]|uniref:Probable membrane transporter protein n=1 Tax=Gulosibacter macacae TaxID=2488791 RepID=A0A3P3W041_9MICO|nr:sulfite exporter TauE/SafE family protein [Gulosibacter macacae]RRJ87837.1 sulfite exporter TauE/SafE family protein [Gulosibacter macacae]
MTTASAPSRNWFALIAIGLAVGLASGLFGIGGGLLIVPALVYLLKYEQRLASGTSLLAIVAPSIAGVISYALAGYVDALLAAILAAGSMLGAPIGTWLLARLSKRALQWSFIGFLVVVIVMLFIVVPNRDSVVHITWVSGPLLGLVGLFAGMLAGLLGVGGGVVVVPALVLLFGASDLVAKGTSLLMIIATGFAGTISNLRRGNVDLLAAAIIGVSAALLTPLGAWIAQALDPFAANVAFAVFLVFVIVRMAVDAWPRRRK